MPPVKQPVRRRRTRTMVPLSVAGNPLEDLPPPPPPARPSRPTFSPYPDLSMAIDMLRRRKTHVEGEKLAIISRWLESLEKMQSEMQKLHKLENLAARLTSS